MRPWRLLLLALVVALIPLVTPAPWLRHGAFPDLLALVVVVVALECGQDRGALTGVLLGLLGTPWTAEPLGLQAFLLGSLGWALGRLRSAFYRELVVIQMILPGAAALVLRLASETWAGGPAGPVRAFPDAVLAATATALAGPPAFALMRLLGVVRAARATPRRTGSRARV